VFFKNAYRGGIKEDARHACREIGTEIPSLGESNRDLTTQDQGDSAKICLGTSLAFLSLDRRTDGLQVERFK